MQNELPIAPPFQKGGERFFVVTVLIVILLLTIDFFPLELERKSIIGTIPETVLESLGKKMNFLISINVASKM